MDGLAEKMTDVSFVMDLAAAVVFLAFACNGLMRGLYKMAAPFLVIALSGLAALTIGASLSGPVTELIYPKVVDALVGSYENGGLDLTEISLEAVRQLNGLAPKELLDKLDNAEQSGVLGAAITDAFTDAADNGLGEAVNNALASLDESETGQAVRNAGEIAGQYSDSVGAAANRALDAARDGVVGDAIDSALDAASGGAVGDAVNDTVSAARRIITRGIQLRILGYVRLIVTALLWVGFIVALTIIKNTFQLATKLPLIKQADRLGGAALGLIECALIFWAVGWAAKNAGFFWLAEQARGTRFLSLFI